MTFKILYHFMGDDGILREVEWLDKNGLLIQTKTSTWLPASATGKASFSIKAVAPRKEAVDYRMDTKKWE